MNLYINQKRTKQINKLIHLLFLGRYNVYYFPGKCGFQTMPVSQPVCKARGESGFIRLLPEIPITYAHLLYKLFVCLFVHHASKDINLSFKGILILFKIFCIFFLFLFIVMTTEHLLIIYFFLDVHPYFLSFATVFMLLVCFQGTTYNYPFQQGSYSII